MLTGPLLSRTVMLWTQSHTLAGPLLSRLVWLLLASRCFTPPEPQLCWVVTCVIHVRQSFTLTGPLLFRFVMP